MIYLVYTNKGDDNMHEYKIELNNTDVSKLWMLARNGIFSKSTVERILDNSDDEYIVFNSRELYEKFRKFEFSASAMYLM